MIKDKTMRDFNKECFILKNGVRIPKIGLGTWLIKNEEVGKIVKTAINLGYIHIDSAQAYGNEEGIGDALQELKIDRSKVFITSKVQAEIKNYQDAKKSIEESLRKLKTSYVDLMLIHCPQPWSEYGKSEYRYEKENLEVWRALEEAYNEKKIKAIGVSNFNIHDLENIMNNAKVKPMVNQCSCYPGNTPVELIEYCKNHDILFEAYCPNAHGRAKDFSLVQTLAGKYKKSFAQICLRYGLSLDVVILPKSTSFDHLKENLDLDFEISREDIKRYINEKIPVEFIHSIDGYLNHTKVIDGRHDKTWESTINAKRYLQRYAIR